MGEIWDQFKRFALKGNVVDLATGVIIGAAFGKVVASLVDNILTPPLGLLIGGVDFSHLRLVLATASASQPEVAIGYGVFLQALVNLLIVSGALFFLIKVMNELNLQASLPPSPPLPPPAPPPTPEDVLLLREIRDCLKPAPAAVPAP